MPQLSKLERVLTRHLAGTIGVVTVGTVAAYGAVLVSDVAMVDPLAKMIDSVVKTLAVLIGSAWALNRYFVSRADDVQIQIAADVAKVSAAALGSDSDYDLLTFRFDIINSGKTLVQVKGVALTVQRVWLSVETPVRAQTGTLFRWPEQGFHPGTLVEPGSWMAISDSRPVVSTAGVLRVVLDVVLENDTKVCWHRMVDVTHGAGAEA
jgi:hypothetical protein